MCPVGLRCAMGRVLFLGELSMLARWKPIPGFPSYEISRLGQVKRVTPGKGAVVGKLLVPLINKHTGRRGFTLYINGKKFPLAAARCIALAFIGPPPTPTHEAAHNEGNCTNDRVGNIRWATFQENRNDMFLHGTTVRGTKNSKAKMTDAKVRRMRKMQAAGWGYENLGAHFSLHPSTCHDIVVRKTWKHVT